jgi:reductive dehalogenase
MDWNILSVLILTTLGLFTLGFIVSSVLSFSEREYGAGKKLALVSFLLIFITLLLGLLPYSGKILVAASLIMFLIITIFLIVKKPTSLSGIEQPKPFRDKDELDTIFARMKLKPSSKEWEEYYQNQPYEFGQDAKARSLPGLLSEKSLYYNPLTFSSANSNFQIIEYLHKAIKHPVNRKMIEVGPEKLTIYLKEWAIHLGAHSVGITELKDYHLYTKRGRGEDMGKSVVQKHRFAFAFTVEMDFLNVQAAPASSIVFESSQQYLNSATIALQLAIFLKNLGHDARAHIDGDYEIICPLVGRDAGLGEIGRMGLLMTPKLGPRVRVAVVTTSAPLQVDKVESDPTMVEFCKFCKKCAECCPGQSIPMDEMKEINGVNRWKINSESCYQYWCTSGTDCGRCISVCPFSHPNNLLHNTIRHLIRRSNILARFAYIADDLLYGRKPKPKKLPNWMSIN